MGPSTILTVLCFGKLKHIRGEVKLKKALIFLVVLFLFVLTQWSSSVYLAVAPKIALAFSSHKQLVVSSLSIFFIGYAVGQLFWGILSDYIGRYLALVLALAAYFAAALITANVTNAIGFVIFFTITGFLVSANTSVGNALVKEKYEKKTKLVLGYVGIAMACAPAIAPIIGSNLYLIGGWRLIFIFLAITSLVILVLFAALFKRKKKPCITNKQAGLPLNKKSDVSILAMMKETLSDREFIFYIIVLAVSFGIFFSILLFVPFLLTDQAHFSVESVAYLMFSITITYVLGAVFNVLFARKKEPRFIVNFGLLVMLFGALVFIVNYFLSSQLLSVTNLFVVVIYMFGIGLILPASKAGAMMARKSYIGTAASIMKFVQTIGCIALTKLTSICINHEMFQILPLLLAAFVLLLALFGLGLPLILKVRNRRYRNA